MRWEDFTGPFQAYLIAYEQTRDYEEAETNANMAKAMMPRGGGKGKK
jgi:hypothetical protein